MPSSSKHHRSSSGSSSSPHKSKHSHHRKASTSGASVSGSPPKSKVVVFLPPQAHPPVVVSSPAHRTAIPPPPALLSRSLPTTAVHSSSHRPTVKTTPHGALGSGSITRHHSSGPIAIPCTSTVNYTYTITPISRSASHNSAATSSSYPGRATITRPEDDYYDHPAVQAYEMQKAAEQARWNRRMQLEREAKQRLALSQAQQAGGLDHPQGYQQRW